jgi:hypothetical protein
MVPFGLKKKLSKEKDSIILNKKYFYYLFVKIMFLIAIILFIHRNIYKNRIEKLINKVIQEKSIEKINISYKKCYLSLDSSKIRIIHLILTRFLIEFYTKSFTKKMYKKDYIINGIRVLKKYLFPSLENQSCKNFIWILILGNKADISYVKSALNLKNNSFQSKIIYEKEFKNYIKKVSSGFEVLITTRIDYDDRIYYDAVNDVRKAVNINRPMTLYGYNRGVFYFETEDIYYDTYNNWGNKGANSIFLSLILVLNKVNDTYTIYDLKEHFLTRHILLNNYKSYGIKILNYEPAIFDNGDPKFVKVKQNYSGTFNSILNKKRLKINKFNLNKFYGK